MDSKVICISPKSNFLRTLAQKLISSGIDLGRTTIVFPNRRAGLYFRYYLKTFADLPGPIPRIYAIEDLVNFLFVKIDPRPLINLYDEIYLIHQFVKDYPKFKELTSIDKFLPWGHYIVQAIDELDMEMVDLDKLKSFKLQSISNLVMDIADILHEIYRYLEHIKIRPEYFFSTKGERYKKVAESIEKVDHEGEHLVIAGFYLLTESEKQIFRGWVKKGAILFLQAEKDEVEGFLKGYGLDAHQVEAPEYVEEERPSGCPIKVYEATDLHQIFADITKRGLLLNPDHRPDRNLILLGDSSKLIPALSFLNSPARLNVTMGFSFHKTILGQFVMLWLDVFREAKEGVLRKDALISWLEHGFFSQLLDRHYPSLDLSELLGDATRLFKCFCPEYVRPEELIETIREKGSEGQRKEVQEDFLKWLLFNFVSPFVQNIFESTRPSLFLERLNRILEIMLGVRGDERYGLKDQKMSSSLRTFDLFAYEVFLEQVYLPIKKSRFGNSLFHSKHAIALFFQSILKGINIPLSGRPLIGNQLMGLLETRLLCFERVVVVEANEGIFPSPAESNPLLPEQLKAALGIRRKESQEEIQRHHFMRIIGSAKEVHLYYISRTEGMGKVKMNKSRFLQELVWRSEIEKTVTIENIPISLCIQQDVLKSKDVIIKDERLKAIVAQKLNERSISATMLNTYLRCPYQFFYKYILGVKLPEDVLPTDEMELGLVIHKTLEEYFKDLREEGMVLLEKKGSLLDIFYENWTKSSLVRRLNEMQRLLLETVVKHRFNSFLEWLRKKTMDHKIRIIGSEEVVKLCDYKSELIPFSLNFEGRCDLIMQIDNCFWSFDFKTGKAKERKDLFSLNKLLEIDFSPPNTKSHLSETFEKLRSSLKDIQMLLYLFMLHREKSLWPINGSYIYISATSGNMEIEVFRPKDDEQTMREVLLYRLPMVLEFILWHILNSDTIEPMGEDNICKVCRICM